MTDQCRLLDSDIADVFCSSCQKGLVWQKASQGSGMCRQCELTTNRADLAALRAVHAHLRDAHERLREQREHALDRIQQLEDGRLAERRQIANLQAGVARLMDAATALLDMMPPFPAYDLRREAVEAVRAALAASSAPQEPTKP